MKIENGIRIDDVIQSLKLYDCMIPEFWTYVSEFFGPDILKDDRLNKKITKVLKDLYWFNTTNNDVVVDYLNDYCLQYLVEDNSTSFLQISHNSEVLWQLNR